MLREQFYDTDSRSRITCLKLAQQGYRQVMIRLFPPTYVKRLLSRIFALYGVMNVGTHFT
jgi:hypothetical protein